MAQQGPVAACRIFTKFRHEAPERLELAGTLSETNKDSNDILAGIQNKLRKAITYNPDYNKYDVLYQTVNEQGIAKAVNLVPISIASSSLVEQITDDATAFLIYSDDLSYGAWDVGTTIKIDDEFLVIQFIRKGTRVDPRAGWDAGGGTWRVHVAERGAHGSAAAAHDANTPITAYRWTVEHEEITITDYDSALPAPSLSSVTGIIDGFRVIFTWTGTNFERAWLRHFRVYFDTNASVTTADEYFVYNDHSGKLTYTITVRPKDDTTQETSKANHYFRVAAVSRSGVISLSNEIGPRKISGTGGPGTDGPTAPDVHLFLTGRARLQAEAGKKTGTEAGNFLDNVKSCYFDWYNAPTGLGVPTTGTPDGNQTQIHTETDTRFPYVSTKGVSAWGYSDYWVRGRFRDANDVDGDWGLSSVFELNKLTETVDDSIVPVLDLLLTWLVDHYNQQDESLHIGVGIAGESQVDSADHTDIWVRELTVPLVNTFFSSCEVPFPDATRWAGGQSTPLEQDGLSHPGLYLFSLSTKKRWQVTARVHNAYGDSWWAYSTSQAPNASAPWTMDFSSIDLGDLPKESDDDVPTMGAFYAWTKNNPPPGGDDDIGGDMVKFGYTPGNDNATVHNFLVEAYAGALPTTDVWLDQGSGSATVPDATYEVTISGYTAENNEFADKTIRLGRDGFLNSYPERLEERLIASNTSGDPFTLTCDNTTPFTNVGAMTYWSIITPSWAKTWHKDYKVNVQGGWNIDADVEYYQKFSQIGTYKFRGRLQNLFGRGAWYYATAAKEAELAFALAVSKSVLGITGGSSTGNPDLADGASGVGVAPENMNNDAGFLTHSIDFVVSDNNTLTWSGTCTVEFDNGTSVNLSDAPYTTGNLTNDALYYIYGIISTQTINWTTAPATAMGPDKVMLGQFYTTSNTAENGTFVARGKGLAIGAGVGIFNKLESLASRTGSLTVWSAEGITVLNGGDVTFRGSDADPGEVKFASSSGTVHSIIGSPVTNPGIYSKPITPTDGYYKIGTSTAQWQFIGAYARHNLAQIWLSAIYDSDVGNSANLDLAPKSTGGAGRLHAYGQGDRIATVAALANDTGTVAIKFSMQEGGVARYARIMYDSFWLSSQLTTKFAGLSYTWPTAHKASGYLMNNGSGVLSWSTAAGGGGGGDVSYGSGYLDNALVRFDGAGTQIQGYGSSSQAVTASDAGLFIAHNADVAHIIKGDLKIDGDGTARSKELQFADNSAVEYHMLYDNYAIGNAYWFDIYETGVASRLRIYDSGNMLLNLGSSSQSGPLEDLNIRYYNQLVLLMGPTRDDKVLAMVGGQMDSVTDEPYGGLVSVGGEDALGSGAGGFVHVGFGGRGVGEGTGEFTVTQINNDVSDYFQHMMWISGDAGDKTKGYIYPYRLEDGGGLGDNMSVDLGTTDYPFNLLNVLEINGLKDPTNWTGSVEFFSSGTLIGRMGTATGSAGSVGLALGMEDNDTKGFVALYRGSSLLRPTPFILMEDSLGGVWYFAATTSGGWGVSSTEP
jgi:hypothetical protein